MQSPIPNPQSAISHPPAAGRPLPAVFVCGYPSDVGGANTELWHTVKLWRRFGIGVTLIPTWQADPLWRARLEAIGCRTIEVEISDGRFQMSDCSRGRQGANLKSEITHLKSLPGGIVVSLCNRKFLEAAHRFRGLGCKIVWLGCMNWLFPQERLHYRRHGCFDRHVFQSQHQRNQLLPQLARFGFTESQGRVIRGAFDVEEFPLRPLPNRPGEALVVGRISRAEPDKFRRGLWELFAQIPPPRRVRVLGWSHRVEKVLGAPPPWAECLAPGAIEPQPFLATLHALVQLNQQAVENWPRVGLEAMAAGVPIIAENRGGWREMLQHGQTGYLCDAPDEVVSRIHELAHNETKRQDVIWAARQAVERLADPNGLIAPWLQLFEELRDGRPCPIETEVSLAGISA